MLDLHVWGAAFGLASIDAECLAIITYLHNALPSSAWRLIPSNDASISPSNLLPALNHDGVWTSGYQSVVSYLISKSLCKNLDADLSPAQKAHSVAYGAYLAAHAAPLIDLSLYVSAANWSATTRPAYSALLPFPLTWTAVPLIRAEAIKRVEHLGLADLDSDFDPNSAFHLTAGRDSLPETFRRHLPARTKKTVREEMTPEQAAAIRLFGLAEDGLSVLENTLAEGEGGEKGRLRFFSGIPVSSLDCLAYGYLALMAAAPVPRPFLRDWLAENGPRISKFVDDMAATCTITRGELPWTTPERTTVLAATARVLDSIVRNVPSLGEQYIHEARYRAENEVKGVDQRTLMLAMSFLATGAAFGYGLYMYKAMQPFGARTFVWTPQRGRTKLSEFGEIGSILSSVFGPVSGEAGSIGGNASTASGRLVEVDSEVD